MSVPGLTGAVVTSGVSGPGLGHATSVNIVATRRSNVRILFIVVFPFINENKIFVKIYVLFYRF
jgi:hypothetical protein